MVETYTSLHNHTEFSSAVLRFPDAICKVESSVNWCYNNGLNGYALTDHQSVSGYVQLEKASKELGNEREFKHIFGNEFYLLSEEEDNLRFSENDRPYYWHYLINVLDEVGLKQMYELSARAWLRSYTYKGLLRRPSFYSDLEEIVGKNPGHLVGSSGCLGGFLPKCILSNESKKAKQFIEWNQQVFGKDNFYLECQPCYSTNEEQVKVNNVLWSVHEKLNVPIIVTTDSHYERPEQQEIHTAFLKSKDGGDGREPEKFYQTTYLFTPIELRDLLKSGSGFNDMQVDRLFATTNEIANKVQPITIYKKTRVPALPVTPEPDIKGYYKDNYSKYSNINHYANSNNKDERYYFGQIEKGLRDYQQSHDIDINKYLAQIDIELEQVTGLSEIFGDCMANYFNTVQKIVDIIWDEGDSLVGIGRGSAGSYVTNKLLGITGIDPLLPGFEDFFQWWRFCSVARSENIFDIDIDVQSFKKEKIIKAIKNYFGERRVCQCVTWGTLSSKTALERAGIGLGINSDEIGYLKSLVPVKRGKIYSLKDCVYGNKEKGREKVPEFIAEINKFPKLLETALAFEGMIVSSGVHAGALNCLKGDFTETGSFMVSSNGAVTSQFNLHDAEYAGDLKLDLLSIDCLEHIRGCLDLLLKDKRIEWQGSLRKTYNKYLGYDVLEMNDKNMWKELPNMTAAFQYDSRAGKEALSKIGASSLKELTLANGLMRLAVPNGEQPMDKYIRYRKDITEWYKDMTNFGIPQDEQEILKELLERFNGLLISQNTMMSVLMDERVCGFTMKQADKARKSVAKKSEEALKETEKNLYECGKKCGRSKVFLDYLWNVQIEMSKSYAFDFSHSAEYSVECIQELNLYYKFPKVYWNTAVAMTQAGTEDTRENVANTTDYGKISCSIYKAKSNNISVSPPLINKANNSFSPDAIADAILFGLAGIAGINSEISKQIISLRPYSSFQDFFIRNSFQGSLVTNSKFIQLIKAGCFDEFEPNRVKLMKQYICMSNPPKDKLTSANLSECIAIGAKPPKQFLSPYNFKSYVCSPRFLIGQHPKFKSKKLYWLDDKALKYFNANCSGLKEGTDWYVDDNGLTIVVDKSLDKLFKPVFNELKAYINTPEFLKEYNKSRWRSIYDKLLPNKNPNHWSLEAVSYYSREHELANVNFKDYSIVPFNSLPEEPVFITQNRGKREWKQYELHRICGTILARNDNNHLLTILTPENDVINVKFYAGLFAKLKAQISEEHDGVKTVLDKPWLARGVCLVITGYRRGESDFVAKKYRNSIFPSTVSKIEEINDDGSIVMRHKRYGQEEAE